MRLTKQKTSNLDSPIDQLHQHVLFWPVVIVAFLLWLGYRLFFHFPIWFDETIGKAVFFGLPVWFYLVVSRRRALLMPLDLRRFEVGLFLGLAIGGIYGFSTAIASLVAKGGLVQAAPIFASSIFWYEFVLALMTGFWESLFFFVFLAGVIGQKYAKSSWYLQIGLSVGLFLLFHLPSVIMREQLSASIAQGSLLALFALGQTLLFYRWRNLYALTLSHAIWGTVLLLHTGF